MIMKSPLTFLLAVGVFGVCACAPGRGDPTNYQARLTEVVVSVRGWDGGRVGAALIDRSGRRTGLSLGGSVDEIPGCARSSGSEDGIPIPRPDDSDTAAIAEWERFQADTFPDPVPGDPATTPLYHYFLISNDAATPVGLIDQGGCELVLEPAIPGNVQLSLVAKMGRTSSCRDTTSAVVKPGESSRWRLSWRVVGEKCAVKIARLPANAPAIPRR